LPAAAPERPEGLGNETLWSRLLKAADIHAFASTWLALQASMLPPLRASVMILGEPDTGPFSPVGVFPAPASISADLSIAAEAALTDRKGVLRDRPANRDEGARCVALPLIIDDRLHGVVAVELAPPFREPLADIGRRLQWGAAWVETQIRKGSFLPQQQLVEILDLVAMTMEAPRLELALLGLANDLARILRADWVACGLVDPSSLVDVKVMSHGVSLSTRSELANTLAGAMQESADQHEIISVPENPGGTLAVTRAHDVLSELVGAGPIMSVPIAHDGHINGIMTIKLPADRAITDREREFCRLVGTVLGPLVEFKRRDDRWIGAKVADVAREHLARLVGPGHLGFKVASGIIVLAAAILSFASAEYRVTSPATLEGAIQRVVSAPIQGYIAQAEARAGDRVKDGEVIARLDDRSLKVERTRWQSEREQHLNEYQRALAEGDRTRSQVLAAEIEQSQARIDLIEEQLSRTEIRAPFDGIIVRGDLSQMLGAPVQRGDLLFEIAPLDDYRILLRVDERDISEVTVGQEGALILSSLPFLNLSFKVTKLTPISVAEEGRNYFRVEAQLNEKSPAIRPGMQGYGKIDVGRRKLLYIATVRLAQWVRTAWWRWGL
jgi:RND family efflux transporter MFP subunit